MKLKNLLFGTMIALAFTACSSDNDPVIDEPNEEAKTTFSLRYDDVATKATDGTISSLQVLVFNNGTIQHNFDMNAANASENRETTPGPKKILVLANAPAVQSTTLDGVLGEMKDFNNTLEAFDKAADGLNKITMNSQIYDVVIEEGVRNQLGYGLNPGTGYKNLYPELLGQPVPLYRNVAKINLAKIELASELGENNTSYPKPSFVVSNIFILHAKKDTKLVGNEGKLWYPTMTGNDTYLNGVINTAYEGFALGEYKKIAADADATYGPETAGLSSGTRFTMSHFEEEDNYVTKTFTDEVFYVYENGQAYASETSHPEYHTLLVIEGEFSYESGKEADGITPIRTSLGTRYYTVAPGASGNNDKGYLLPTSYRGLRNTAEADATQKYIGVLRNLQYNLTLNLKGIGYKTPFITTDKTLLDVKCTVVDWGVVEQEDNIQ